METIREMIARLEAEVAAMRGWIEVEGAEDGAHLAGGHLACRVDAVEFDDDAGFRARIPYSSVVAIRFGRPGETEPLATFAPPPAAPVLRAAG